MKNENEKRGLSLLAGREKKKVVEEGGRAVLGPSTTHQTRKIKKTSRVDSILLLAIRFERKEKAQKHKKKPAKKRRNDAADEG